MCNDPLLTRAFLEPISISFKNCWFIRLLYFVISTKIINFLLTNKVLDEKIRIESEMMLC